MITLDSLVGEHVLDAADICVEKGQATVLRFRLNGQVLAAVEDPHDGYASSLDAIQQSNAEVKNTFTPLKVQARKSTDKGCDVVEFRDAATGDVVLRVGTDGTDTYEPCFVAELGHHAPTR